MQIVLLLLLPGLWVGALLLYAQSKWAGNYVIELTIAWLIGLLIVLIYMVIQFNTYSYNAKLIDCMLVYNNPARCTYEAKWNR